MIDHSHNRTGVVPPIDFDRVPLKLRERPQWVLWKHIVRSGETAPTKLPFQEEGEPARSNDPSTWTTFECARRCYDLGGYDGIGFMFSPDDPFLGIDLDNCRDPETGELADWARDIIDTFATYTEISPSGSGVKLFLRAEFPTGESGKNKKLSVAPMVPGKQPGIETYGQRRYFAVTGERLVDSPVECTARQSEFDRFFAEHWPRPTPHGSSSPRAGNGSTTSDVLARAEKYVLKIPGAVSGQRGHDATYHVACVLRQGFDLSLEESMPILERWNTTCQPAWSEAELRHKLEDAGRAEGERGSLRHGSSSATPVAESTIPPPLPPPHPSSPTAPAASPPRLISNVIRIETDEGEEISVPLAMPEILPRIKTVTGDWPRRVGTSLFVHEGSDIDWLCNTPALLGYLGSKSGAPPKFVKAPGYHAATEVFAELQRTATAYLDVETLPHHPRIPHVYYACSEVRGGDGSALRELLDRFNPETPIDRDLILAMLVSPGWGAAGNRPSFGITSDAGRGSGKTTLAKLTGRIWGGRIEVSPEESVEIIKQRLLSPEAMTRRVVNIDNLKSMRFSNAGLEALVTADVISGKRLYHGEASRPNTLIWITTLNGVSFATDWAQRSVIIKLRKPVYSGDWQDEIESFIDARRDDLIADCIGFLQQPCDYRLPNYSRWGHWERDVLSRLPEPAEAQRVILERQALADAEGEESDDLLDTIRERIRRAGYTPDSTVVFIPSKLAAEWLNEISGERFGTNKATRAINQRIGEGRLPNLSKNNCGAYGRGFIWRGERTNSDDRISTDLEFRLSGGFS